MDKKVRILILSSLICLAVAVIGVVFYYGVLEDVFLQVPDYHGDILYKYSETVDFEKLYSGQNEIEFVATRYSALYKIQNTMRQMYVSSMPLRNAANNTYSFISTNIENKDDYHVTENTDYDIEYRDNSVFIGNKKNWVRLNIPDVQSFSYGDCVSSVYKIDKAVRYTLNDGSEVCFSPSYNGVVVTGVINEGTDSVSFPIKFADYKVNNNYYGGIALTDRDSDADDIMANNRFIISMPIISAHNNSEVSQTKASIKNGELICSLPKDISYPATYTFTVNYYCENMFFDCAAVKQIPNTNHIFDSYIIYDSANSENSICNYMKFNIRSFTPKKSDNLDQILLNLYVLHCEGEVEIEVYAVRHDWCSWELTWNNQPNHNEKIGEFKVDKSGWYSIDLTEYTKRLIDRNYYKLENNSIMFKVKDTSTGNAIFTSTDNSVYPPFFEVNYRNG